MKKKKILIVLAILIIIILIAIFATMYFIERSKYDYKIQKVTQIDYNVINVNDRYGVINRNGDVIIEPTYDIIQIPNPSKDVFICMYEYNVEKKAYKIKVLNANGEELYKDYNSIQAIPTDTTYDGVPYEKTVLKYEKDGKYGLLNINGKEITKPIYDQISAIAYKEGMLLIKQDDKCGVININGKIVIPVEYETITADNYYSEKNLYKTTGFIVSKKTDEGYRYGYINYKGKKILDTQYTEIERVTEIQDDNNVYIVALKDGQAGLLKNSKVLLNYEYEDISYNLYNDVFVIQRNSKQGITDRKGNIKIQPEYDNILFGGIYINAKKDNKLEVLDLNGNKTENQEILSKIPTKDGKHYIISGEDEIYKITDENENVIIDKGYSYIEEIKDNHYIVANNNKNGIIDLSGKANIDLKYNSIFKIENTELIQANISSKNSITLIDKNMKVLASMENAKVEVQDNYVRIYSDTDNKYFDYEGKELSAKDVFPNNKLYAKKINEKWGFVDKDGNLKVQNEYDMVTEFNEYGFAGIKKDGKWGSINSDGKVVQEPTYKISWTSPKFIGEFYKSAEWYGDLYYTNKLTK